MIVGVHNFAKGSARRSAKAAARRIIWRAEIGCGTRRSIMVLVEQGGEVTGINIAIRKTAD
ncbi:hypothetical protein A5641_22390 [Mycobacterium sp. 1554424.7]|nr:hypothetical protein A5641_22390 [Mycobacterium sp. 1554424.7]